MRGEDQPGARRGTTDQIHRLDAELQQVVDMHHIRPQRLDHRAERGEPVGVRLRQPEAVEMAEPDQRLVRCVADALQQRAGPAFAVRPGHRREEHPLNAMQVAQRAEQPAGEDLGATGLQAGMVVAEEEDPHQRRSARAWSGPSAPRSPAPSRRWCSARL